MDKLSEMLIAVSGDVLRTPDSLLEMQAHLDLVKHAWNLSLLPQEKTIYELNIFLRKQEKYAPSVEALKGLEWEYRRIIKQKRIMYPSVLNKVEHAEAVETSKDNYIIRAYFRD
jgi:hypothetical protein